jgi:hypothetical protein
MAFSEGRSDTGGLTGRGNPFVCGAIIGAERFSAESCMLPFGGGLWQDDVPESVKVPSSGMKVQVVGAVVQGHPDDAVRGVVQYLAVARWHRVGRRRAAIKIT